MIPLSSAHICTESPKSACIPRHWESEQFESHLPCCQVTDSLMSCAKRSEPWPLAPCLRWCKNWWGKVLSGSEKHDDFQLLLIFLWCQMCEIILGEEQWRQRLFLTASFPFIVRCEWSTPSVYNPVQLCGIQGNLCIFRSVESAKICNFDNAGSLQYLSRIHSMEVDLRSKGVLKWRRTNLWKEGSFSGQTKLLPWTGSSGRVTP